MPRVAVSDSSPTRSPPSHEGPRSNTRRSIWRRSSLVTVAEVAWAAICPPQTNRARATKAAPRPHS